MLIGRKFHERVKKILSDPAFDKPISELNKGNVVEIPKSLIANIRVQIQWQSN